MVDNTRQHNVWRSPYAHTKPICVCCDAIPSTFHPTFCPWFLTSHFTPDKQWYTEPDSGIVAFSWRKYSLFYYSVITFQIFRVNRGTWLVNSRHVTQTQTSVYFGTDMLKWPCSTRACKPTLTWWHHGSRKKSHTLSREYQLRRTYVSFVNARKP